MPIEFVSYTAARHAAVERFNAKLAAGGSEWQFPPRERPPDADELPTWTESFVAADGDEVYAGYIFKHQRFLLEGEPFDVCHLQLPLSLGQVDGEFAQVSAALIFDVIRRSSYVFSLGLGAEDTQFAKLLTAAGWRHITVPFHFSVKSPNRFARNIRLPPGRARLQRMLRLLGGLRLAGLAFRVRGLLGSRGRPPRPAYNSVREIPRFERFADDLLEANAPSYGLVADRSAATLDLLYPEGEERYLRLVVERGDAIVGWAVVLDTQMRDDKYFGDLRVGSLADCFASPEDAPAVVAAADDFLSRRGVDIVVSNQLHPAWCAALEAAGYESGPSNFFFYFSEGLAERAGAVPNWERQVHLNRGDGEGPGHL
jgi:hypothetical protein